MRACVRVCAAGGSKCRRIRRLGSRNDRRKVVLMTVKSADIQAEEGENGAEVEGVGVNQ